MSVIDDLIRSIQAAYSPRLVKDVLVGLHYTYVYDLTVGLAATPDNIPCCFSEPPIGAGHLHERDLLELMDFARSKHPLEAAIGFAAINSQFFPADKKGIELNAGEYLSQHGRDKTVVVVGHFPFTEQLREVAKKCWVLELNPQPGDTPADLAPEIIPQADIIGLTATTLVNGTFESLMSLSPPKALVVMLGPTTPMSEVMFDYGVDILAGVKVDHPVELMRCVGQGSSLRKPAPIRRFTMAKKPLHWSG